MSSADEEKQIGHDSLSNGQNDVHNHSRTDDQVLQTAVANSTIASPEQDNASSPRDKDKDSRSHANHHSSQSISQKDEPDQSYKVDWDGEDDLLNPLNMPTARKWLITMTLAFCAMCVTCTSSLYTTTYDQLEKDLNVDRLVATLGLSLYVFGLGLSPMFLGPLSEFYGRRYIYILAFGLFTVWLVPCAVAQNIETMLLARFFDGLCGSAFLSVAGSTVGDMFTRQELQAPMMIFTASPFLGPGLGPVVGGFINQNLDWRWSFYVLLIWAGLMLAAIVLLVPETYHPAILRQKARRIRAKTSDERYKAPIEVMDRSLGQTIVRSLYRPFLMLALDPMCLNLCLFSSILLGILYLFFGAFGVVFSGVYGFDLSQVGLSFCGLLIGMVLATASDPMWQKNYERLVRKNADQSEPEYRLPPSIAGSFLVVIGLFWFAWTIQPTISPVVPLTGAGFFGAGIVLVYSGIFTFLVEAFPLYAASALAANSFARSSFAAAFPLFGIQMYKTLGFHWASSLLAFLTVAMAPFPYVFFVYGRRLRKKSRFSPAS